MPSVMTIEGASPQRCNYVIGRGQYGKRKFVGCYRTKSAAKKAARRKGRGWTVVHSRPPDVPVGGLGAPAATHVRSAQNALVSAQHDLAAAMRAFRNGYCNEPLDLAVTALVVVAQAGSHVSALKSKRPQQARRYKALQRDVSNLTYKADALYGRILTACVKR